MIETNFIGMLEKSLKENWELTAFSDYQGKEFSFKEVGVQIVKIHVLLEECKVKKGDKVAIIGRNSSSWAITFLAINTYGAVVVPILPDFHSDDMHNIINHSDSVCLFVADQIFESIDIMKMDKIQVIYSLNDFSLLQNKCVGSESVTPEIIDKIINTRFHGSIKPDQIKFEEIPNSELAEISYTSGTTGNSKGVMLSFNSLAANVVYAQNKMPLKRGDHIVSFLPLAHSYGCAFEFLFPFTLGVHVHFLTKIPPPQLILQAFHEVRPNLILSVPLVIEKIYRKQVYPKISKNPVKSLLKIPGLNKILFKSIKKKLMEAFGDNFHEIVIGGAAFNSEIELFFKKINFPFTIGYGMTECGPLISYAPWDITRLASAGKLIDYLEVKIDSGDPYNEIGEIMIKGENVMNGYYKNEAATKAILDPDGWLHTGDLGVIDKDNFIYIKGRSKNMLLGSSGQNIYTEEIEEKVNNMPYVQESVVIEEDGKLVALVFPDFENAEKNDLSRDKLIDFFEEIKHKVNSMLPKYSQISRIKIYDQEFEKTPKKSIKTFLYQPKK